MCIVKLFIEEAFHTYNSILYCSHISSEFYKNSIYLTFTVKKNWTSIFFSKIFWEGRGGAAPWRQKLWIISAFVSPDLAISITCTFTFRIIILDNWVFISMIHLSGDFIKTKLTSLFTVFIGTRNAKLQNTINFKSLGNCA